MSVSRDYLIPPAQKAKYKRWMVGLGWSGGGGGDTVMLK